MEIHDPQDRKNIAIMAGDQDLALPWTDIEGPCRWCGKVLARAPARTAARWCSPGYMGKGDAFEDAIADFSIANAARPANECGLRDPRWHGLRPDGWVCFAGGRWPAAWLLQWSK